MPNCPRCRKPIETDNCPDCDPVESGEWHVIARVSDLAEVGFIADALEDADIPTQVVQYDQCSALDGGAQTLFLVKVPTALSQRAVETLQAELVNESGEIEVAEQTASWEPDYQESIEPLENSGRWRSIVLLIVAGSLAYAAGRYSAARPISARQFWNALGESSEHFRNQPGPGEPRRQFWYDPDSRTVRLEVDRDRDGAFEFQKTFLIEH